MQSNPLHPDLTPEKLPFDVIVEQLNDGVLIVSFTGEIIYVNHQMSAILGYDQEEMYGKQLFDFMREEWAEQARANLKRRATGAEERFDHQFLHKQGHAIWTMVSTRPIKLDHGERISLVAIRDITQRIEAEEALRTMKDELEERVLKRTEDLAHEVEVRREAERLALEASEIKSRLLANMSHELRTPLNAIIGYTELLLEEDELSKEQASEDLTRILSSSKHLLNLVNDVLDLSKLEAGHEALACERFKPEQLLCDISRMLEPLIARQHNRLILKIAYSGEVWLDRLKLKQILINLMSNAAKFTTHGTITVRLSSHTLAERTLLELEVEDTGEGIAQGDLPHLFQPFVQSSSASYARKSGTGLGLAITKRYCEMMRGYIKVTSKLGQGARFSVVLPAELDITPEQGAM